MYVATGTRLLLRPVSTPRATARQRPPVGPSTSVSPLGTGRVLELQRTVGNRAVASMLSAGSRHESLAPVQRHPEHAEEQDVQRHPEHAEEQEVQPTLAVQKWPGKKKAKTVSQAVLNKEQAMTTKFGVQIGPANPAGGGHLSLKILNKIELVLDGIPKEHLRGNALSGGIAGGAGLGNAASAYDAATHQIEIVVPPGVPDWLYPILDKSSGRQRWLMDVGAKMGYEGLGAKGIVSKGRKVMGGGKGGKRLGGNLLEWTVRHELGHAVDQQIKWTTYRAKLDECGGWQQHERNGNKEAGDITVLDTLLTNAGFSDHMTSRVFLGNVSMAACLMMHAILMRDTDTSDFAVLFNSAQNATQMRAAVPGFNAKWKNFLAIRKKAMSQPWSLSDGGGPDLQRNGRMYFVDSYEDWTSCLVARRNSDSLSRYMFSNPGEWFAEAYAAYYAPQAATRNQLSAPIRAMFGRDLGEPDAQRQGNQGAPALATGQAGTQELRALQSDTDGLVAALNDESSSASDTDASEAMV